MNAISSIKTQWHKPKLRRFRATEELAAELVAQSAERRRAAADRRR